MRDLFHKLIETFMNTADEWHSFLLGLFEVITIFKPRFRITPGFPSEVPDENVRKELNDLHTMLIKEVWYYQFGRVFGVIFWVILGFIIVGRI